jgi:hypothetical protein
MTPEQIAELVAVLRAIVEDASPCTSACSRLVDESLIERAEELLVGLPV